MVIYYVPFPGYWLYECSIRECGAKLTRRTREEIQTARSEHDQEHACSIAWVASEEVSGLQGEIVLAGECVQEGLPL